MIKTPFTFSAIIWRKMDVPSWIRVVGSLRDAHVRLDVVDCRHGLPRNRKKVVGVPREMGGELENPLMNGELWPAVFAYRAISNRGCSEPTVERMVHYALVARTGVSGGRRTIMSVNTRARCGSGRQRAVANRTPVAHRPSGWSNTALLVAPRLLRTGILIQE